MTNLKVFIFEGIATSGKSTVINAIVKALPKEIKTRVYTEAFTHLPIIDKTDELCTDFFMRLVAEAMEGDNDVVFFDRLYLTQANRAGVSLDRYLDLEMMLYANQAETILLKVDETEIPERITQAMAHRDPDWAKYVATKGKTTEQRAGYYISQQRNLLSLLAQSRLPQEIFDVTAQKYARIIEAIKTKILT